MGKKLLIDATHAEETRVVVLDGTKVEDFDFETIHKRQLAGNIYLAKVTRVEPSLQAAFVDYGGNRHGFLAFAEIHPDYYQIPVADRQALLAEERALARDQDEDEPRRPRGGNGGGNGGERRRGGRGRDRDTDGPGGVTDMPDPADTEAPEAEAADAPADATTRAEDAGLRPARAVAGMDIVDLDEDDADQPPAPRPSRTDGEDDPEPYRAADHASELDDQIESVADEDVSDEVRPARRPRAKRYKIQEVVKVRQIMLVQVVKEERGNKGAALTTYLSLAGRYCVLMPNTGRGGGISRKITNVADRKKLKEIAGEMEVPEGAGLIIRTAGANRTKQEIKRDYEYLFRLWEQIRDLTLKSIAPAPIYEEGDLIKRSIRDLYTKDIEEVLVEGEAGYRAARDFMKMIMPTHAKMVKPYAEPMPLFARYQVEGYLAGMFNPTVQLKSGGYIVIGVTEALVAIDINSGKATRQGSIEETALQTNLEAADEIARQLRLRDLAGLIVIDFIDMEERRNNASVEKRLKDALRNDRARIQVGRISGFGLLEMSRQRLRPGMLEATTQPCPHCHGTGLIRSDNSIALAILRALEEEGVRARSKEVLVRAPIGVVNYLFNAKREHLAQIEVRYDMAIRIEADPSLVSPDYSLEKFKTATRVVRAPTPVVSLDAQTMSGVDEYLSDDEVDEIDALEAEDAPEAVAVAAAAAPAAARATEGGETGDGGRKKRRRRRRRRGGEGRDANGATIDENGDETGDESGDEALGDEAGDEGNDEGNDEGGDEAVDGGDAAPRVAAAAPQAEGEGDGERTPARRRRTRGTKPAEAAPAAAAEDAAKPKSRGRGRGKAAGVDPAVTGPVTEAVPEAMPELVAEPAAEAAPEKAAKPRRSRRKAEPEVAVVAAADPVATAEAAPEADLAPEPAPEPAPEAVSEPAPAPAPALAAAVEPAPEPAPQAPPVLEAEAAPEPQPEAEAQPAKSRRLGWWARKP